MSLGRAKFDVKVLAFDVAQVVKPLPKCLLEPLGRFASVREAQVPDPADPIRQLIHAVNGGRRRSYEKLDELASSRSITPARGNTRAR